LPGGLHARSRDLILPVALKELVNKVTEARKAAESNLITRREETAALRSRANPAKLRAENPTLIRMRALKVLEKVVSGGKLSVVLGEIGSRRPCVVNLIWRIDRGGSPPRVRRVLPEQYPVTDSVAPSDPHQVPPRTRRLWRRRVKPGGNEAWTPGVSPVSWFQCS